MTRRKLLVLIPLLALVLNGIGYLVFTRTRPASTTASSDPALGKAPPSGTGTAARSVGKDAPTGTVTAEDAEKQKEQTASARRAAGMAALEAGDYDKALINFTEARSLIGDRAKVGDLLRVTEDLRSGGARTRGGANAAPRAAAPVRKSKSSVERRVASREEDSPAESGPPPGPVASGLLIVTTTPRGLLVQVDDTAVDLTPMRTKVRPGVHRVALLDGDRKVYETTVDVKEGGTSTLLKDLGSEVAAEAPRSAVVTPPPAPSAPAVTRDESATQGTATKTLPPPLPIRNATATPPAGATDGTSGALEISSPGLYGVVWINGRPRGYPPLVVRGLPLGPTKVEVRVNGIQKRSSTVMVKAGSTLSVMLRSSESAQ